MSSRIDVYVNVMENASMRTIGTNAGLALRGCER